MSDTPERVDHAEAIRQYAQRVRSLADAITEHAEPMTMHAFGDIEDDTTAIERHADGLAADLARVIAYARHLESQMGNGEAFIAVMQREWREDHGVADLMRDTNKEAR